METTLVLPQGQFQIRRFPLRRHELLQAWDAADEYLLNYMAAERLPTVGSSICILNDGFGALALALNQFKPLAISDSFLSQQSTRRNLESNLIPPDRVRLLDSLATPVESIDLLLIKVPKTLALLEDQLHRLRPLLKADSRIIAAGMVKNLPASVWKLLEMLIGPTTTSLAVKKARLIFASLDTALKAPENPYPISYPLENTGFKILNHANVFSRDSLDIGTRFFLDHLPDHPDFHSFIDLGCGNGLLGLTLAARRPEAKLTFVDESYMAIASARENYRILFGERQRAEFVVGDCLDGFPDQAVDCIVCNPPFHQQHAIGDHIARQMFREACRVLRKGGEFRVIGNRHLNYDGSLKKQFGNVTKLAGNVKFVIFKSVKC
ncbi:MAG: methyltransferase [Methylococcales bacterium]|nr:methyltransferase [Methylococcales bacterium]